MGHFSIINFDTTNLPPSTSSSCHFFALEVLHLIMYSDYGIQSVLSDEESEDDIGQWEAVEEETLVHSEVVLSNGLSETVMPSVASDGSMLRYLSGDLVVTKATDHIEKINVLQSTEQIRFVNLSETPVESMGNGSFEYGTCRHESERLTIAFVILSESDSISQCLSKIQLAEEAISKGIYATCFSTTTLKFNSTVDSALVLSIRNPQKSFVQLPLALDTLKCGDIHALQQDEMRVRKLQTADFGKRGGDINNNVLKFDCKSSQVTFVNFLKLLISATFLVWITGSMNVFSNTSSSASSTLPSSSPQPITPFTTPTVTIDIIFGTCSATSNSCPEQLFQCEPKERLCESISTTYSSNLGFAYSVTLLKHSFSYFSDHLPKLISSLFASTQLALEIIVDLLSLPFYLLGSTRDLR